MELRKLIISVIISIALSLAVEAQASASEMKISFSPDGKAWTTNAGDQKIERYDVGTTVKIRDVDTTEPEVGQHYYVVKRGGVVPVAEWRVVRKDITCIHHAPSMQHFYYHGIDYTINDCYRLHFSAWFPICAYCGETIFHAYVYMSSDTAASINRIDLTLDYYYLCPYCRNLEQGASFTAHDCKAVSNNLYYVKYEPNAPAPYVGNMSNSTFIYGNETLYNGQEIDADTHLKDCNFVVEGYKFICWNSKADGTGTVYQAGQRVENLSEKDGEVVRLYAIWEKENEIGISCDAVKLWPPKDKIFIPGQAGLLKIETKGCVEKVQIILPKGLIFENQSSEKWINYSDDDNVRKEEQLFFVNLSATTNENYTIIARCYKNDKEQEARTQISVVGEGRNTVAYQRRRLR